MDTIIKHHKGSGYARGSHEKNHVPEKLLNHQGQTLKATTEHKRNELSKTLSDGRKFITTNNLKQEPEEQKDLSKEIDLLSAAELKKQLLIPDEKLDTFEIHNIQNIPEESTDTVHHKHNKDSFQEKINIPKRIKEWKDDIEESFKESLCDMLEAKIITKEQKEEIEESLKSPQVMESIRTRISVFGFSTLYIGVNTVTVTPLAGLLGGAGMGTIAYLLLYLLKRFLVSGIVSTVGKNLDRKNYISNMSIIPILGEQITLIELYKKFPLAAQMFYASMRTKKARKAYKEQDISTDEDVEKKEHLRKKWEKKVHGNAKWIKDKSAWLVNIETKIGDFFTKTKKTNISKDIKDKN